MADGPSLTMKAAEMFDYMIACLKEWNYPEIHAMDHAQISDIFSSSNRIFLVSWIMSRIYPDTFTSMKCDTNMLANAMYDLGLCTSGQKHKIFSTEFFQDQVTVLYKMFYFSKVLSQPTNISNFEKVTIKDVEEINEIDLNLFPSYGPLKVLTEEQWEDSRDRLDQNRKLLEFELVEDACGFEGKEFQNTLKNSQSELEFVLNVLNSSLPQFKLIVHELIKCLDTVLEGYVLVAVDENVGGSIKTATENLRKLSQYFCDIRTITNFVLKHEIEFEDNLRDKDLPFLVEQLVKATQDVLACHDIVNIKPKTDQ